MERNSLARALVCALAICIGVAGGCGHRTHHGNDIGVADSGYEPNDDPKPRDAAVDAMDARVVPPPASSPDATSSVPDATSPVPDATSPVPGPNPKPDPTPTPEPEPEPDDDAGPTTPGAPSSPGCSGSGPCCGNGILEPDQHEQCDDGNFSHGDGCRSCRVEQAWRCEPEGPCIHVTGDPDCDGNACQDVVMGTCVQLPGIMPCRCPLDLLPSCPQLALISLSLPDDADSAQGLKISGDGTTVVGNCGSVAPTGYRPMVWGRSAPAVPYVIERGMRGSATGVSFDGSVVVGSLTQSGVTDDGFRLTHDGIDLFSLVYFTDVSWNGEILVGGKYIPGEPPVDMAFTWTTASGFVDLGSLEPAHDDNLVWAISGDGKAVVGLSSPRDPWSPHGFRWTQQTGMEALELPAGTTMVESRWLSADGSRATGLAWFADETISPVSVQWKDGHVSLFEPPSGIPADAECIISDDEKVYVCNSNHFLPDGTLIAWDAQRGARDLRAEWEGQGIDLSDWQRITALDLSADGKVGIALSQHLPQGEFRTLLFRL